VVVRVARVFAGLVRSLEGPVRAVGVRGAGRDPPLRVGGGGEVRVEAEVEVVVAYVSVGEVVRLEAVGGDRGGADSGAGLGDAADGAIGFVGQVFHRERPFVGAAADAGVAVVGDVPLAVVLGDRVVVGVDVDAFEDDAAVGE